MRLIEGVIGACLACVGIALMTGTTFEFLAPLNHPDVHGAGTFSLGVALAGGGIVIAGRAIAALFKR